jgi:hypothetical protein
MSPSVQPEALLPYKGVLSPLEDGEVGKNCAKLIAKYTILEIPDNFVAH